MCNVLFYIFSDNMATRGEKLELLINKADNLATNVSNYIKHLFL